MHIDYTVSDTLVSVVFDELYDRIPHPDINMENSITEVNFYFFWLYISKLNWILRTNTEACEICYSIILEMEYYFSVLDSGFQQGYLFGDFQYKLGFLNYV